MLSSFSYKSKGVRINYKNKMETMHVYTGNIIALNITTNVSDLVICLLREPSGWRGTSPHKRSETHSTNPSFNFTSYVNRCKLSMNIVSFYFFKAIKYFQFYIIHGILYDKFTVQFTYCYDFIFTLERPYMILVYI